MKQYEEMSVGENLSWCKPLTANGWTWAVNEGEICGLRRPDGTDAEFVKDGRSYVIDPAALHELALAVVRDYSEIADNGWTDLEMVLSWPDDVEELGCADCPWRDECDAMIVDD